MKMDNKVIYQLTIEDVQNVAREEIERELSIGELQVIEDKIGDYIHWYELIDSVINSELQKKG